MNFLISTAEFVNSRDPNSNPASADSKDFAIAVQQRPEQKYTKKVLQANLLLCPKFNKPVFFLLRPHITIFDPSQLSFLIVQLILRNKEKLVWWGQDFLAPIVQAHLCDTQDKDFEPN